MRRLLILPGLLIAVFAHAQDELATAYDSAVSGMESGVIAGQPVPANQPPTPELPVEIPSYPAPEALAKLLESLPATDTGTNGKPGSPLLLVFIGSKAQIRRALKQARWTDVPRNKTLSLFEGLGQFVTGARITKTLPFTTFFVEGRKQDANWAQVVHAITQRHHFRLWRLKASAPDGRQMWWGSGDFDSGIRWKGIHAAHTTSPDISAERDFIARTLMTAHGLTRLGLLALPQIPREGVNQQNDPYFTDGLALVVEFGPSTDDGR